MGAGVVAALGGALGGILGGKLSPKPPAVGPDTKIPGIVKAVIQPAGKRNKEISVANVDPAGAISYFMDAAKGYETLANKGLDMYGESVLQAIEQYKPYEESGTQAVDEYARLMGLKSSTGEEGYTGKEAMSRIQDTPGYQFKLRQGEQSAARAALAAGIQGGGGTLAAANQFGAESLAGTAYQNQLTNLQPLMSQGQNASTAIANLIGQGGTNAFNTYQNIAGAHYGSYMNAGTTTFNAAIANMQAQNEAIAAKNAQDAGIRQSGVVSAAGMMNASTNQQAFNYAVFQNQQGGQAFYNQGGSGGGGNLSAGAGTGWPVYNSSTGKWGQY